MTNISHYYRRVRDFMLNAKQETPVNARYPDSRTRELRARLIIEEALETVEALGCHVRVMRTDERGHLVHKDGLLITAKAPDEMPPVTDAEMLKQVVDGLADTTVVVLGTFIACGVPDEPAMQEVCDSNDTKFREGFSFRDDGKLRKSPLYRPANFSEVIKTRVEL